MDNTVFLSIVIPTYNRAYLIGKTLQHVLSQTCPDFEVIVIDDGSTDDTEAIVKPFLSEKVSYHKIVNSERGAARNRGTELAKGTYINWFDSDDEMLPHHVQQIKTLAASHGNPEVITVHYAIKNAATNSITAIDNDYKRNSDRKSDFLMEGNYLACNPVIVRKDIALTNPFIEDRSLSASEDYELWLRLKSKYPFLSSSEITSYLIQHPERSVNQMTDPARLEQRFLAFLDLTVSNDDIRRYLGRHLNYFVMRNYLVLAVDLAFNGHKRRALHYLIKAFRKTPLAMRQKVFWATIKHLIV